MTTLALNNLLGYLQSLSLSQNDREWLANKLIMPAKKDDASTAEKRKEKFLKLAGSWSDTAEGEEYYQMMKHRNANRPVNRGVNFYDD